MFSSACSKKKDYYAAVNKHEVELLEEKRKQDKLRAQIQYLRKNGVNQAEISSQELNSREVLQSWHLDAEVGFVTVFRLGVFQGTGWC